MTIKEHKKIKSALNKIIEKLDNENIPIAQYDEVLYEAKLALFDKLGVSFDEFEAFEAKQNTSFDRNPLDTVELLQQSIDKEITDVKSIIPTDDKIKELSSEVATEISKKTATKIAKEIAEKVAKKHIKAPKITNQIIKEITKPIKETVTIREEFNDKKIKEEMRKEFKTLEERINDIKLPEALDVEGLKKDMTNTFGEMFEHNINVLGMPDFRKLAMGLQGQIDEVRASEVINKAADVEGPASATDNAIARFDATTGKLIQNSGITISDADVVAGASIDADTNTITNIGFSELDAQLVYPAYLGWVAASTTSVDASPTSNGTTVTLTVTGSGTADFDILFSTGFVTVDATPALTATLTPGTDAEPTLNYAFIKASAPTVVTVDSAYPTGEEFHPVGTYLVQTAATAQTYGIMKAHNWTDHIWKDNTDNGHIAHLNEWIRKQPSTWVSGSALTPTLTAASPDTLTFATSAGVINQLHEHTMPAFDSSGGGTDASTTFFVVNKNADAYAPGKDLYNFRVDSAGNAIGNNKFISWVVWGVVSENAVDSKTMVNLPSGFYSSSATAISDSSKYTNYNIPADYTGTGFLIAKLTYKYTTSGGGDLTLVEQVDLRGTFPSIFAGGSAATTTEFVDSAFKLLDDGDATKIAQFQASGITTATTRTMTIPDADGTIALTSDNTGIYDGSGTILTTTTATITDTLDFTGGAVGINNSAPTGLLDIKASALTDTAGNSPLVTLTNPSAGNLFRFRLDTSGQFAIDGQDAAGWTEHFKIGRQSDKIIFSKYGSGTQAGSEAYILAVDSSGNVIEQTIVGSGGIYEGNGTTPSTLAVTVTDNINFGTNLLYIDEAGGEVGIGTATPGAKLHIAKDSSHPEELIVGDDLTFLSGALNARVAVTVGSSDSISQFIIGQGPANHLSIGWLYNATPGDAYAELSTSGGSNDFVLQANGGNVGIGSAATSPGSRLDVAGAVKIRGTANGAEVLNLGTAGAINAVINTADEMYFNIDSDNSQTGAAFHFGHNLGTTSATELMRIQDDGNVGIGTTSPDSKLEVEDGDINIKDTATTTGSEQSLNFIGAITGSTFTGAQVGTEKRGGATDDIMDLTFSTNDGTSLNEVMRIRGTGLVGIGTTSPASPLTVKSSGTSTWAFDVFESTSTNKLFGVYETSVGDAIVAINNTSGTQAIKFVANGDSYFNGGNVGIGTTSPTAKLQMGDTLGTWTDNRIALQNTSDPSVFTFGEDATHRGFMYWDNTLDQINFGTINGSSYLNTMVIDNGNVGIGTTSPGYELEVAGVTYVNRSVFNEPSSEDGYRIKLVDTGGIANDTGIGLSGSAAEPSMWFNNDPDGNFRFLFGSSETVRFTNDGSVGIGTTAPSAPLEISRTRGDADDSIIHITRASDTDNDVVRLISHNEAGGGTAYTSIRTKIIDNTAGTVDGQLQFATTLNDSHAVRMTIDESGNVGIGATSPIGKLDIHQTAVNTSDDPNTSKMFGDVTTTNNTVTTIITIPITANRTYSMTVTVIGRRTGGSAGTADDGAFYEKKFSYTTKSGTVTALGLNTIITHENVAGWNFTNNVSGSNVLVQVTGATNTNISWHAIADISYVGS